MRRPEEGLSTTAIGAEWTPRSPHSPVMFDANIIGDSGAANTPKALRRKAPRTMMGPDAGR